MSLTVLPSENLRIGEAVFTPGERALVAKGQMQRLEPRLSDLLVLFCAHPGTVLEREWLLESVWGEEGSDEALTQAISRLRQLLGDRSLIRTEPRRGYSLNVEPVAVEAAVPEPVNGSAKPVLYTSRTVRIAFLAGTGLGLLLAGLAWAVFAPRPVTVFEEVTQPVDGPPSRRTVRCDGDPEDCVDRIERPASGS